MRFRSITTIAAAIMLLFGIYLLWYGSYFLWNYAVLQIPEIEERYSGGMSILVGYTFIRMLGIMVFGSGLLAWFTRTISDVEAQRAVALGLFLINALAFLASLSQQILIWRTEWGKFHTAVFLALAICFGYIRFTKSSVCDTKSHE